MASAMQSRKMVELNRAARVLHACGPVRERPTTSVACCGELGGLRAADPARLMNKEVRDERAQGRRCADIARSK
jgi:hypothetical protein